MKNNLQPVYSGKGRAIYVQPNGTLYRSYHLTMYRSNDNGQSWKKIVSIPRPFKRKIVEPIRLLCRLLRHEVRAFFPLRDGRHIAATRSGIFYSCMGDKIMYPAKIENNGYPMQYPRTLSCDKNGRILWGEYWGNSERREVRIYVSDDYGQSFHIVHTFKPGETRHVHNILYDETIKKYWVFTGDHNSDPGIGLLDYDFSSFEWVRKGKQMYRAVWAFDLIDHLVYATDTEKEINGIYILDKNNGKTEHITEINGSCIYATRCGDYYVISTSAEPVSRDLNGKNPVESSIWLSTDGYDWRNIYTGVKDLSTSKWSYTYFQFGSLVLPRGESRNNTLMFSGQALKKVDGKVFTVDLSSLKQ